MAIATPAAQTKSLELVCPAGNLPSPVSYTHLFVEVIIAPAVTPEALAATASKQNVRVLACGQWDAHRAPGWDYKRVTGGLLVQDRDLGQVSRSDLKVVTKRPVSYTHLDVYKRQPCSCPASQFGIPRPAWRP